MGVVQDDRDRTEANMSALGTTKKFLRFFRNCDHISASRLMQRGVRVVTIRERWGAVAAGLSGADALDDGQPADVQAAWSWRPEAGAKPAAT
ncbi:hypothetical protein BRAS3809_5150035 [Bradyrhizobium sp. STM 3809]|nr:hypothetical protein BRAS3809_5150035 [Bradyrhizobium sp. STM 3809]